MLSTIVPFSVDSLAAPSVRGSPLPNRHALLLILFLTLLVSLPSGGLCQDRALKLKPPFSSDDDPGNGPYGGWPIYFDPVADPLRWFEANLCNWSAGDESTLSVTIGDYFKKHPISLSNITLDREKNETTVKLTTAATGGRLYLDHLRVTQNSDRDGGSVKGTFELLCRRVSLSSQLGMQQPTTTYVFAPSLHSTTVYFDSPSGFSRSAWRSYLAGAVEVGRLRLFDSDGNTVVGYVEFIAGYDQIESRYNSQDRTWRNQGTGQSQTIALTQIDQHQQDHYLTRADPVFGKFTDFAWSDVENTTYDIGETPPKSIDTYVVEYCPPELFLSPFCRRAPDFSK